MSASAWQPRSLAETAFVQGVVCRRLEDRYAETSRGTQVQFYDGTAISYDGQGFEMLVVV